MLYDSHAHYDDPAFDADRDTVISEVYQSGVRLINNIASDTESSKTSIRLAEKYDFIYATVGVHPSETFNMTEEDIAWLFGAAKHKKVVAIGEIGLDYHYDEPSHDIQKKWLRRQIELAKELDLPVVIHDRESKGECRQIIKESGIKKGVIHCFSGSAETAAEFLKMGFHISFTGVLTFKNARKALSALKAIPIERLLIETDCPYMTPEPHRGKRNDSRYVRYVAEKIAAEKGLSFEEVAKITADNAKRLFGIS